MAANLEVVNPEAAGLGAADPEVTDPGVTYPGVVDRTALVDRQPGSLRLSTLVGRSPQILPGREPR